MKNQKMNFNMSGQYSLTAQQAHEIKTLFNSAVKPYVNHADLLQMNALYAISRLERSILCIDIDRIVATLHKALSTIKFKFDNVELAMNQFDDQGPAKDYSVKLMGQYQSHMRDINKLESIIQDICK